MFRFVNLGCQKSIMPRNTHLGIYIDTGPPFQWIKLIWILHMKLANQRKFRFEEILRGFLWSSNYPKQPIWRWLRWCKNRKCCNLTWHKKPTLLFRKANITRSSYCCTNIVAWSLPTWSMMQFMLLKHGSNINVNIILVFSWEKVSTKPKKKHITLIIFATILLYKISIFWSNSPHYNGWTRITWRAYSFFIILIITKVANNA